MTTTVSGQWQGPFGVLTLVADDEALLGAHWPGQKRRSHFAESEHEVLVAEHPVLRETAHELDEYCAGTRTRFDVPLRTSGDAFSEAVWQLLLEIPLGETTTYGALGDALGNRSLAQRIGQAVGGNPIAVLIPCHRVLGADGSLTGFAGGLEAKRWLLSREEPEAASAGRLF